MSKPTRSSRRARRGAGCWLRRPRRLRRDADIEQPDCVAAGLGGPSSSDRRACPDGRRGGEGSAEPRSGRSRDGRPRAPVCARFRPGCGRRHAPRRRARVSSSAGVRSSTGGDGRSDADAGRRRGPRRDFSQPSRGVRLWRSGEATSRARVYRDAHPYNLEVFMRRTILTAAVCVAVLAGLVTGSAGAKSHKHPHARAAQAAAPRTCA